MNETSNNLFEINKKYVEKFFINPLAAMFEQKIQSKFFNLFDLIFPLEPP